MAPTSSRDAGLLWQTKLEHSQLGSHRPVYEPLNDSIYITDGWGSFYSAIRLRRISLADGAETGSVLLRDAVGCVCYAPDGDSMIAVLGKRLVEVNRSSLEVIQQWSTGVPRYSFHAGMHGRSLLLMNWRGPSLTRYDLEASAGTRKRAGSCQGILPLDDHRYLVCSGNEGIVWLYSFRESSLTKLIDTPPFIRAKLMPRSSQLLISLGKPYEISKHSVVHHSDSTCLRAYDVDTLSYTDYTLFRPFHFFEPSVDGSVLHLAREGAVDSYAVEKERLVKRHSTKLPRGFRAASIIDERSLIIAVAHRQREQGSTLAAVAY
jgi:hypothetical protein